MAAGRRWYGTPERSTSYQDAARKPARAWFDQTDGDASVARGEWSPPRCSRHRSAAQTPRCRHGANRPFLAIISPRRDTDPRYGTRGREQAVRWNSQLAKSQLSRARQAESA